MAAGWLEQMKQRRVFRALVGYGIVSFAILQIVEPIMHGLSLPEWVLAAGSDRAWARFSDHARARLGVRRQRGPHRDHRAAAARRHAVPPDRAGHRARRPRRRLVPHAASGGA